MKTIFSRVIAVTLALAMILSSFSVVMAADESAFSDFPTGWSREAVAAAVDNGLLFGMGDGTIAPKENLTRAQMAAIITRAFGATIEEDISKFTDVSKSKWYYHDIAKAVNMGVLSGVGGNLMNPDADITRQEVFAIIARALVLDGGSRSALNKFTDASDVAEWAVIDVASLAEKGYVNGYTEGTLCPTAKITREEFAQVMHNIIKTYITSAGDIVKVNPDDCVMIRVPGVTIRNVNIGGDLILGDGVGKGDVTIINADIGGRLLCRGGEGKVTLMGTTTNLGVVVKDVNGVVNFNNYRSEKVFDGVREITPATYLEEIPIVGGGSRPIGGTPGGPSKPSAVNVSINTDVQTYVYDGNAKAYKITGKDSGLSGFKVYYKVNGYYTDDVPTDAGTYDVRITRQADESYRAFSVDITGGLVIEKAGQGIPSVTAVKESAPGANDGKITGVNSSMEYRKDGDLTWTAVTGVEITGLAPGKYYVRYKEDANHKAGNAAEVIIGKADLYDVTIDTGVQDFVYDGTAKAYKITGKDAGLGGFKVQYKVGGVYTDAAPVNAGSYDVKITRDEDSSYNAYSKEIPGGIVIKKATQGVPTVSGVDETVAGANDGKITGVNSSMEYRKDGDSTWTAVTGGEITGLAPGKYYVRHKETANHEAGSEAQVVIGAGSPVLKDIVINTAKQTYTYNGTAKAFAITGTDAGLGGFTVQYKVGGVYVNTAPTNAGTYDVKITRAADSSYKAYSKEIAGGLVINKATQSAPSVTTVDETKDGAADGKILGVNSKMEYRKDGSSTWIAITGGEVKNLTAGKYYVRYKEDENHLAGAEAEAIVGVRKLLNINITPTIQTRTYDGTEKPYVITGADAHLGGFIVRYKQNGVLISGTPVNAGTYDVVITRPEDSTYNEFETEISGGLIIKKAQKNAPNVTGVNETMIGANDGKIKDVDSTMEYRKDGETTWTAITGTEVTNLAAGKYYVRYKETDNYLASDETAVVIGVGDLYDINIDNNVQIFTYDGTAKTYVITGTDSGLSGFAVQYKVNGAYTDVAPVNAGTYDVKITRAADATYNAYEKEIAGGLVINKATQTAPVVSGVNETKVGANDGKIIGVDSSMEYRKDGETTWTAITGTEVTGLAAGKYYVRYAETDNYLASSETEVIIGAGELYDINIDTNVQTYTYDGTAKAYVLSGEHANIAGFTIRYKVNGTYTDVAPVNAGTYDVWITREVDGTFKAYSKEVAGGIVINKATRNAPSVTSSDETGAGANDGTISGVNDTMEYRKDGEASWTAVTGGTVITGLSPGKYYVRYKETDNYYASEAAEVVIAAGLLLNVDLDINRQTYTYDGTGKAFIIEGPDANLGGFTVQYKLSGTSYAAYTDVPPVNAGTYDIWIKRPQDSIYNAYDNTFYGGLVINKATQTAPVVSGVNETMIGANDGKIVSVDSSMEYRKDGETTWTAITGTEVTGLAAGKYYVRYKETDNYLASSETEVVIGVGELYDINIDTNVQTYTYDGTAKEYVITGTDSGLSGFAVQYKVNGAYTDVAPVNAGTYDVKITRAADATYNAYEKEIAGGLVINKATQTAPVVSGVNETKVGANDGKIIGVDSSMEYRKDGETTWTAITGTEVTGLAAGKYYVRYAETDNYLASSETEVVIGAGELYDINIDTNVQTYTYDGTAKAYILSGEHANIAGFTIRYKVNGAYTDAAPVNAGTYDVWITREVDGTFKAYSKEIAGGLVIEKEEKDKPVINAYDETIKGKKDGMITDVDETMEYRKDGETSWIAVTGTQIANLAPGKYYVRYKGSDNNLVSDEVEAIIREGRPITVYFDTKGGSAIAPITGLSYGDKVTKPADPTPDPSWVGAVFGGWYDNYDCTVEWDFDTFTVKDDTEIYASWIFENYTVRFFDGYTETGDASLLENSCEVAPGMTTPASEFPATYAVAEGYVKNSSVDPVYTTDYQHEVEAEWWYVDDNGEWAVFDETVKVNRDIDAFKLLKYFAVNVGGDRFVDKFGRAIMISIPYDSETRLFDSAKDFIYVAKNHVQLALDETDAYKKLLNKLASMKYPVVDSDGNVLNQVLPVKIISVISVEEIEAEIEKYLSDIINRGGNDLKSLLNYVDLEDLIEAIGVDTIINNLDDAALLNILKDDSVRPSVVEFLMEEIVTNSSLRSEVVSFLTNKIKTDAGYLDKLVKHIKDQIKAGNRDITESVATYVQSAIMQPGDLQDMAVDFFIRKVTDPVDASFRNELIANDDFINSILSDVNFRDAIIDNIIDHEDLLHELLEDPIVRADIADSLEHNDSFLKFIVGTEQFEEFFIDEVKDSSNAVLIKNLLNTSTELTDEIIDRLVSDSSFAASLKSGSVNSAIVDYVKSSADIVNRSSKLHKSVVDAAMGDAALKAQIKNNNGIKSAIVSELKTNNEFLGKIRSALGLAPDNTAFDSQILSALNNYIANPEGTGNVIDSVDVTAEINAIVADIIDNPASYGSDISAVIENEISDIIIDYVSGSSMDISIKTAVDNAFESYSTKMINDYLAGTLDTDIAAIIDDAIVSQVIEYVDGNVSTELDGYISDAIYDFASDVIIDNSIIHSSEIRAYVADIKADTIDTLVSHADEFEDIFDDFVKDPVHRDEIEKAISDGFDDIKDHILAHNDSPAVNKSLSDFLFAYAADPEAKVIVKNYLATHILEIDMICDLLKENIDSIDDQIIKDYVLDNIDSMGALIEEFLLSEVQNPASDIDTLIDDFIVNDLDVSTVATFRTVISSDDDIEDLIIDYISRDPDAAIDRIVAVVDAMSDTEKEELVDTVVATLQELDYYKEFMNSFKNGDETFVVNSDNISFVMGVASAVKSYNFEKLKDRIYANKGFEKIIKLIGEDVIAQYLDNATLDYYNGVVEISDAIEADKLAGVSKDYEYKTSITFKTNIVNDIVVPVYRKVMDKVRGRLEGVEKADYNNNVYLQALVKRDLVADLLEEIPGGPTETLSGYKLKDPMAYYDFLYAIAVLTDDALLHYNYISYDEAYAEVSPYIVKLLNKSLEILKEFDETGDLPANMDDRLAGIERIAEFYDTFDKLLNSVADVIIDSKFDKEYTEDELKGDIVAVATKGVNAFWSALNEYNESGELPEKFEALLNRAERVKNIFNKHQGKIDTLVEKLAELRFNHTYTEEEVAEYEKYVKRLYTILNGTDDPVVNIDSVYNLVELLFGDILERFAYEPTEVLGYEYEDAYQEDYKDVIAAILRYFRY